MLQVLTQAGGSQTTRAAWRHSPLSVTVFQLITIVSANHQGHGQFEVVLGGSDALNHRQNAKEATMAGNYGTLHHEAATIMKQQ